MLCSFYLCLTCAALVACNQPEKLSQGVVQNFCGMMHDAPYAVFDLVPTARAGRSDNGVGWSRAHRG